MTDCAGYTSLTFWACGCHLRCPYCHNWRIAEWKEECVEISPEEFIERLEKWREEAPFSWRMVDCVHVTGGEPLLTPGRVEWFKEVSEEVRKLGKWVSVNSSLTVNPKLIERLLERTDVSHIAFDFKWPFAYQAGLPEGVAEKLFENWKRNVRLVLDSGVRTELRIPVSKKTDPFEVAKVLSSVLTRSVDVAVVNPLVKDVGNISPRNPGWDGYKGKRLAKEEVATWKRVLKGLANKVYVRSW